MFIVFQLQGRKTMFSFLEEPGFIVVVLLAAMKLIIYSFVKWHRWQKDRYEPKQLPEFKCPHCLKRII